MPIYEYCCEDCRQIFEEWQKDFEDREKVCPVCGGTSKRLISNSSFVLKGGGWYASGYSKESGGNGKKTSSSSSDTSSSAS
jgi:putative FmdB family regulatory protein